jgi:hypothetical protein
MGVFLRWGAFGIIAVAALLYAYNASKDLAGNRQARAAREPVVREEAGPSAVAEAEVETDVEAETAVESQSAVPNESEPDMPVLCEEERLVAERALKFRRDGEPLDRLLRIQVIAFEGDAKRRERLEAVARQWFEREGRDPNAAVLREEVLRDCRRVNPSP